MKTLEILRDTDALATIHATGERDPGRRPRRCSRRRACPTTSPAIRRCSASCSRSRSRPSIATGPTRTTSCTTRSRSACTPAGRCPSPTAGSRGSCARPHAEGDIVDRVAHDLRRRRWTPRSSARAQGRRTAGRRRGDVQAAAGLTASERGGEATDDPRRKRRPVGGPGCGPAAGAGREPGRGRRDGARPAPRPAQVHGLAPARDAREAGPRGAGRRDRQVPARDRRPPPRRDARSGRSTCARSRCPSWTGSRGRRARRPASACSTATSS